MTENPEANFSASFAVKRGPHPDVLMTVRGMEMGDFLTRLDAMLAQHEPGGRHAAPAAAAPAPAAATTVAGVPPAAAPATAPPAAAGGQSEKITIDVVELDTFYVEEINGKRSAKVRMNGGQYGNWSKHGVKAWPEVMRGIGVDIEHPQIQLTTEYQLPNHVAVAVVLYDPTGGKSHQGMPVKVIKFRDAAGADLMPVEAP